LRMLLLVLLSCGVSRLKERIDVANFSIQNSQGPRRQLSRAFFCF
jgi:hypothetical protein